MKINQTVLIILLAAGLAVQTIFLFNFYQKNKSLEKSMEYVNKEQEDQKKQNKKDFDSIQQIIHWQDEHISDLESGFDHILGRLDKINNRSNENKTTIRNIRGVDNMRDQVANRYIRR